MIYVQKLYERAFIFDMSYIESCHFQRLHKNNSVNLISFFTFFKVFFFSLINQTQNLQICIFERIHTIESYFIL